jgi:predicted nucleic acid-binding protein
LTSPINVVYDVNVLVGAGAGGNSPFRSWPSPPPTSGNPYADCMGIVVDCAEFALWTSPHILQNVARVLTEGFKWPADRVDLLVALIEETAAHSGGGVLSPPQTVTDCKDWEDNRILDLAAEVGALLIISEDTDLTSMSPWRGTPVLRPKEFVAKVDGMRRHARRR